MAQVYQAGRAVRESTGTSDKAEARRLLKEWEGQIAIEHAPCWIAITSLVQGDLKEVARRLSDSRPTIKAQFQAQQATKRS